MTTYETFSAAVRGGALAGGVWNARSNDATTVLAVHGITASHLAWPTVAARLGGIRMIAPDLRGRGRSNRLPEPWGIRDHADDLARVLDHFEIERVVVLGHSMGGFVAVRLADQYPERVSAVVLVDGGLPLPILEASPVEDLPARLLGPAGERLRQTYTSRYEYQRLWRGHPAFAGDWSEAVEAYVDYDLEQMGMSSYRPSTRYAAVAANIVQMSGDDGYRGALAGIRVPLSFLRAPRGLLDEVPPLYPHALVASAQLVAPQLQVSEAPDVNHYTIVMSDRGADWVAAHTLASASAN